MEQFPHRDLNESEFVFADNSEARAIVRLPGMDDLEILNGEYDTDDEDDVRGHYFGITKDNAPIDVYLEKIHGVITVDEVVISGEQIYKLNRTIN